MGREHAKQVLRSTSCGQDGYLSAYDHDGLNLVHPKLLQAKGHDLVTVREQTVTTKSATSSRGRWQLSLLWHMQGAAARSMGAQSCVGSSS